ncbi:MAG: hypothetical protein HOD37_17245 [Bacteroidetes bacterium]|nr:hypothetical protein [Bacteroidota bacterium]
MKNHLFLLACFIGLSLSGNLLSQEVEFGKVSVDVSNRIQIEIESSTDYYYVLYCRPDLQSNKEWIVSITLGQDGQTIISEQLKAYPSEHYRIVQHPVGQSIDLDQDGISDINEIQNLGRLGPLNPAEEIAFNDGVVSIPDRDIFEQLSYNGEDIKIDVHLKNLEFVKFFFIDTHTDKPKVYFMNTETHRAHRAFAQAVGIRMAAMGSPVAGQMRGEIIYHPNVLGPNGFNGVYRFEFEPNDSYSFEKVQMAYEMLAANMPILRNNLAYYPMPNAALPRYHSEKLLYDASRVAVLFEEDIYADITYIALNQAEGYGLLRLMDLDERPHSRDVVIYEALPNEMPRTGGIITTVPQTPLSHVNLRAIQDNVPNAYVKNALDNQAIKDLMGKYVYYKTDSEIFEIREATLSEVENWYVNQRPTESQYPERDLSLTNITSLDQVDFDEWKSFGVKAANVATMRKFGFEEGAIPYGFAIPFYFYDEFMKFNGFYDHVDGLLSNPDFQNDYSVQDSLLQELRDTIRAADMPTWMWDALSELQSSFPDSTSLRCRSSTNNEDLPGFSGAGLYNSKTQHPEEGHISKSVKQVFASLWTFRAFDERQFYRIEHATTAMGILVHPSYSDELANGVAVTTDPLYFTEDTYYLNVQIGEDLVTNPDALSIPEEGLLSTTTSGQDGYTIVRFSNLVENDVQILGLNHLDELRDKMTTVRQEFQNLYGVESGENFAMEIEFKITDENNLVIKQARPWVFSAEGSVSGMESDNTHIPESFHISQNHPNPFTSSTTFSFDLFESGNVSLKVYNLLGYEVSHLIDKALPAGSWRIQWHSPELAKGQYLAEIVFNGTRKVIKVLKVQR